jgi:hypothetical protein
MQVHARLGPFGFAIGLLAAVATVGCKSGTGDDSPDSGPDIDAAELDVCTEPFDFAVGDATGHTDPLGVEPGQARAGRLAANQLPPDPDGLSVVDPDDFVLANEHIALIIEDAGPADLWDEWGGKPVGMGLVRDGAIVEPVDFNEMMLSLGVFIMNTESVTVMNDGSDGGPARIRSVGTLDNIGSLGALIQLASFLSNSSLRGLKVAFDYELAPGAEHVEVSLHVVNTEDSDLATNSMHLFFQDSRTPLYTPELGFASPFPAGHETPLVAFADKAATNYAWEVHPTMPEPLFRYFLAVSGATVFRYPEFTMEACRVHSQPFGRLHVGGPDVDGLLETIARTNGDAVRAISGTVTQDDGSPAADVSIHATDAADDERYVSRTSTAADGTYTIHVPADQEVELTTWRRGDRPVSQVATTSDTEVNFDLPPVGAIQVTATDGVNDLPVRVQVIPDGLPDYVTPPRFYGEPRLPSNRLHVEFPHDGQVTMRVPPGQHQVVVSRGYDYELSINDVQVDADEVTPVPVTLDRVITSPGHLCGDFHIHTFRSPDAGDPKDHKILAAVGDGVELPVLTDHRFVGDFEETIQEMQADGRDVTPWAYGISALELTTFRWGHMCVAPLAVQPDGINGGFINWVGQDPPDVFDEVRSRDSGFGVDPAIIIAHGRAFGGQGFGEYFTAVGYQPTTGVIDNENMWDESFRLIEVFNSESFDDMISSTGAPTSTLRDWFSFLNFFTDRKFFAVGSSDSHNVLPSNSPVGYPRTCINLGLDTAEDLRATGNGPALVRNRMYEDGDMTVHGGIYVTATASDGAVSMGGTVEGAAETEEIHVRVEAPCWIDVDRLEVWVNGEQPDPISQVVDLAPTNGDSCDPVRFDTTLDVSNLPAGRSWAVVHVAGQGTMAPVFGGRQPFGVTNPIFFMR